MKTINLNLTESEKRNIHIHMMGIGGSGISSLAMLLHHAGFLVSGCDQKYSPIIENLTETGIKVFIEHDKNHLFSFDNLPKVDILVASEAISKEHPEILCAIENNIPVLPRMEVLNKLMENIPNIGVIGTHGKTTTTSMTARAFQAADLDPSAFVGAKVAEFGSGILFGKGVFIAEIDESDKKFADLKCETIILTNMAYDHVGSNNSTYWKDKTDQKTAFKTFLNKAKTVIYNAECPELPELIQDCKNVISFGLEKGDYRAEIINKDPSGTDFNVFYKGELLIEARSSKPGDHNVKNALSALAALHLYGGDLNKGVQGLKIFKGPSRRWEHVGNYKGAILIDDYAHNPDKTRAAVDSGLQMGRNLRTICQPHRFNRFARDWQELSDALLLSPEIMIVNIYSSGETPIEGMNANLMVERLKEKGHKNVKYFAQHQELFEYLKETANENDLIVSMGAGDVNKILFDLAEMEKGSSTGARIKFEPLSKYTTVKIGGKAEIWRVSDTNQILEAMQKPFRIIGAGSNLVVSDKGIKERIIYLDGELSEINISFDQELTEKAKEKNPKNIVTNWIGAGASLQLLLKHLQKLGLSGLEGTAGIPAKIGGAVFMNAGTSFGEIFDAIHSVEIISNDGIRILSKDQINYKYRNGGINKDQIVTRVRFELSQETEDFVKNKLDQVNFKRQIQPKNFTPGCAFKNYEENNKIKFLAGKTIDEAGLKGLKVGGAMVSDKHANFIVNTGNATFKDIMELIKIIKNKIKELHNIDLEVEYEIWE